MVILSDSDENKMISAFLRAEIDSPRFGQQITTALASRGYSREMVANPDFNDEMQNIARSQLLDFRGYSTRTYLFDGFPKNVIWQHIQLGCDELSILKYAKYPPWIALSSGSRLVVDGARNIDTIMVEDDINFHVREVVNELRGGKSYPELIAVEGDNEGIVLLEGHTRATAYALAGLNRNIDIILGHSPLMNNWWLY